MREQVSNMLTTHFTLPWHETQLIFLIGDWFARAETIPPLFFFSMYLRDWWMCFCHLYDLFRNMYHHLNLNQSLRTFASESNWLFPIILVDISTGVCQNLKSVQEKVMLVPIRASTMKATMWGTKPLQFGWGGDMVVDGISDLVEISRGFCCFHLHIYK